MTRLRIALLSAAAAAVAVAAPATAQTSMNMPGMKMPAPKKEAAAKKPPAKKGSTKKASTKKARMKKGAAKKSAPKKTTNASPDHDMSTMPGMNMPPTPPAGGQAMSSMPGMDMPAGAESNEGAMVRFNQFMLYSHTSGPRGQSRLTGPGNWMLMYDKDLSSGNHLSVDMMGTPEQLTVGNKGTPQLLQTENIDAMHPHDYIMALEFRDSLTLNTHDKEQLTFLFAPRGEAAIGPVPFMHRQSAEGNPDAPLGHALQDGFHDVSTVLGIEYQFARTTIEATAFSGKNIVWPLPLHNPDSYSVRVNQNIDDRLSLGASYADALLPNDTGAEHDKFISAWLTGSYLIANNTLKFSLVWGQGRAAHGAPLNSFLEEAVYQQGRNKFYDRAEILQITPDQLELVVPGGGAGPKWAKALTIGYERTVFEKNDLSLFVGGSYTQDFTPGEFQPAYGSDPMGGKVYLRMAFHGRIH